MLIDCFAAFLIVSLILLSRRLFELVTFLDWPVAVEAVDFFVEGFSLVKELAEVV